MGLFNRIFGKGDVESDKIAESDLQKIKSGEINKIYPILKPGDWVGIKAGALKQTIIGTQEEPELVVAFGYDTPDNFVFLMPHDLEEKKPSEILKEAYDNLEKIESNFEISETLNRQVLTASGQDFSSEKILCRSHMLKAHELLNAKELYVSIPRRKCMMITSKEVDEELGVQSRVVQIK
ncbi:hypothetical protein, partial [Chryseobacterium gambrini]|uniref:hypothetical protein n=1 Tax=Chryseobacterium gambrini TaxID=373672 RepID=UPI003BA4DEE3